MSGLAPGLWTVLATPFTGADHALDTASLTRETQVFAAAGAVGLVALGVFGEAAALDAEERDRALATVVAAVPELPVVVGLPARATAPAIEQAQAAVRGCRTDAGDRLAGVMVQVHSGDAGVVADHLHRVHAATGAPVVLQDYPALTGVRIGADALVTVVQRCPFVVAVKAEAPPTPHAIAGLAPRVSVPVFGGLGGVALIDELAAGAAGAMTGFSHPEALAAVLSAWDTGGFAAAHAAWSPWLPLATFEQQAGIALGLRKQLLARRGIIDSPGVRPPAPAAPERLLPLLDQHLAHVRQLAPDHRSAGV